jgi:lysozyme family protein
VTAANFPTALQFTLSQEGGWSDDPNDPGGCTNQGITLATYRAALGQPNLTSDDLRAMTDEQRDRIYLMNYWNPIRGDDLPSGIDIMVFDFGVNAGPGTAAKMLQRVVGATQDGAIGPLTLAAVDANSAHYVITALTGARLGYYLSLNKPEFIDGWNARAEACEAAALGLLAT